MKTRCLPFLITALLFLFGTKTMNANPPDSLVYFSELQFVSSAERAAYIAYLHNDIQSDLLGVFALANRDFSAADAAQYKARLDELLAEYKSAKWQKKPLEKKINAVYKKLHQELFKRYQLQNHFSEIFTKGDYNCVSASAVFAIAFEELGIPYDIMEAPTHVYLSADPGKNKVLVETTDPLRGYFEFDHNFKNNFRNHLRRSKLITEDEYHSATADELFERYYFAETPINIRELAGLQYANLGIYFFEQDRQEDALAQFEKSYLLYPSEKMAYMLTESVILLTANADYGKIEDVDYLIRCSRFVQRGLDPYVVIGEFYRITNEFLINIGNRTYYDEVYEHLREGIKDSALRAEIEYIYHYEKGRVFLRDGREDQAFDLLETAMHLKPDNSDLHSMMVMGLTRKVAGISDPQLALATIQAYGNKFPVLTENGYYKTMEMEILLLNASQGFDQNKVSAAAVFLSDFEQLRQEFPDLTVDAGYITRAYGDGAAANFRIGRISTARTLLTKGLDYAPNSYELKRRLEMIR